MSDYRTQKIWHIPYYLNWVKDGTPINEDVEYLLLQKTDLIELTDEQLGNKFDNLPNVKYINLSKNRGITHIPSSIEKLKNLKSLDLPETGITTVQQKILDMGKSGVKIYLKGTPFYNTLMEQITDNNPSLNRKLIDKETMATNIIAAEDIKITDLLQDANYKIFIVKNNYYYVDILLLNNIKRKFFWCNQNNNYNSDSDSDSDSEENYAKRNELFALQNIVPFNGYVLMDDFKKAIASMDNKYFELEETSKKINSIKKETGECIELKDPLSLYSITPILVSISESSDIQESSNMQNSKRRRVNERSEYGTSDDGTDDENMGGGRTRKSRKGRKSRKSRKSKKSMKSRKTRKTRKSMKSRKR